MSRRFSPSAVVAAVLGLLSLGSARAADVPAVVPALRIIELHGDSAAIGRQHGVALRDQIQELHRKYLGQMIKKDELRQQALLAAAAFRVQLRPEHRAELIALAEAAGMDSGEMMLGNCFLDLLPGIGCSTITVPAEASADGVGRFGRNLDWESNGIADSRSVVLIFRPEGRYAFAAITWPGLIGVLTGMNQHGLTLANMEVDRPLVPPQAMPYILLYRTVLERCRTVDEAIAMLEKTPRQSANNLMLMDAGGNRAVVEIKPEKIVVRRGPEKAALISTNHQRGIDQDTSGQCWRYDLLRKASVERFGRIDAAGIEKMLAAAALGKMTIQSMVFEPSKRTIYLAVGTEAHRQSYNKLDLEPLLKK